MKKFLIATLIMSACFTSTVWGSEVDWVIEGKMKIEKTDAKVNINPYNIASVSGVGDDNILHLLDTYETIDILLNSPLYQLSSVYADRMYQKDGVWGVERNIGVKIFDGTEDWEQVKSFAYQNNNSTLFVCSTQEEPLFWSGKCTHFDVFLKESQKKNRYDGISFGEDLSQIYMRIMNVRNIKTVDELKTYLKAQYDAGTPVKFFYVRKTPQFEPFDEKIQKKLQNADWEHIGFMDKNLDRMMQRQKVLGNSSIFAKYNTDKQVINRFMRAVKELRICNSQEEQRFYLEGLYPTKNGFYTVIKDEQGKVWKGTILFQDYDVLSSKPVEVYFKTENGGECSIRMRVDLSQIEVPTEALGGFSLEQTEIQESCKMKKEMILPTYIPVMEGQQNKLYLENTLIYGNFKNTRITEQSDSQDVLLQDGVVTVLDDNEAEVVVDFSLENAQHSTFHTKWIPVSKKAGEGQERTVLFLGDSLLNQDLYTSYVAKLFEQDSMKITMIGTRGLEHAKHEGRGGWAAYDYCNVESKYGFTNPFLNQGKFDFSYYMNQNKYSKVDEVVINLGINDLNLLGHNGHDEIISYYDEMIQSIRSYDSDIKILLNLPALLFGTEQTQTAKDTRLAFIQTMKEVYGNREDEGIFLVPIYTAIDPRMGYKLMEPSINEEHQSRGMIVTDTTHPNNSGYESIAETTYAFLKYVETLQK